MNEAGIKVYTGELKGFVTSLRYLSRIPDIEICVVLDGTPVASKKILPQYKGNRGAEDIKICIPPATVLSGLQQLIDTEGLPVKFYAAPGQEADQCISSIAYLSAGLVTPKMRKLCSLIRCTPEDDSRLHKYRGTYAKTDFDVCSDVVIATTDADMYQLQATCGVGIDTSCSFDSVVTTTPDSVHGVSIYGILPYKILLGDSSDNIPSLSNLPCTKVSIERELATFTKEDLTAFCDGMCDDRFKSIKACLEKSRGDVAFHSEFMRNRAVTELKYFGNIHEFTPESLSYTVLDMYGIH